MSEAFLHLEPVRQPVTSIRFTKLQYLEHSFSTILISRSIILNDLAIVIDKRL